VYGIVTTTYRIALDDDIIQPFQLETTAFRGRLVRLGGSLDEIMGKHAYPAPVARLLAEALALAGALAGALKYDGIFTLQTKGDGPVGMMVADVTSAGDVRGYAQFDAARLDGIAEDAGVAALVGKGYLAFTVDQGEHTERYQGIVELLGETLADCTHHYFRQSEQLVTGLSVTARRIDGQWRAGALMLQRLAEGAANLASATVEADDWKRSMVLMGTVTSDELVDPQLTAHTLLFRLFHEEGVRAFAPVHVRHACRCSRERVETVLRALPADDIDHMKEDGVITATCEFCSTAYRFTDDDMAAL